MNYLSIIFAIISVILFVYIIYLHNNRRNKSSQKFEPNENELDDLEVNQQLISKAKRRAEFSCLSPLFFKCNPAALCYN